MAKQPETLDSGRQSSDEAELEKLEADVKQLAQKIIEYRETLPGQLQNTLSTILASQRPVISTHFKDGSEPCPNPEPVSDERFLESGGTSLAEGEQENAQKVVVIKQKITSNAAAIPLLLKRLRDSMSRIDKSNSCNETIHPVFKRTRTN